MIPPTSSLEARCQLGIKSLPDNEIAWRFRKEKHACGAGLNSIFAKVAQVPVGGKRRWWDIGTPSHGRFRIADEGDILDAVFSRRCMVARQLRQWMRAGGLVATGALLAMIALPTSGSAGRLSPLRQGADSTCGGGTAPGTVLHLALPAQFTLELVRSADSLDYENACEARVLDSAGEVAWHRSGFWAWLDGWTGHDVNGNGRPDAVIVVDVGGGNRCCREYTILDLGPTMDSLTTLQFEPDILLDARGRTVFVETIAFYDLGTSMADAPALMRVFQFRQSRLARITSEYCPGLLTDTTWRKGKPRPLKHPSTEARATSRTATGKLPWQVEQTRTRMMSLALQNLECGHRDAAERLVRETWPAAVADSEFAQIDSAWVKRMGG